MPNPKYLADRETDREKEEINRQRAAAEKKPGGMVSTAAPVPSVYSKLKARLAKLPGVAAAGSAVRPEPVRTAGRAVAPAQAMVAAAVPRAAIGVRPLYRSGQAGVSIPSQREIDEVNRARETARQALEDYLWDEAKRDYMSAPNPAPETAPVEIGERKKR